MATMWGADIAALEALGRQFRVKADELQNAAQQLSLQSAQAGWQGSDAQQFQQVWQGEHRPRLMAIASALRTTGDRLIQQAHDQESASNAGAGGGAGMGTRLTGSPAGPGNGQWPSVNDILGFGGPLLGTLGDARNLDWARHGGSAFQYFGYFTDGAGIYNDLGSGRYVDAGVNTVLLGGDVTADAFKASKTPHGYGIGVAIQSVTQAGRAAQDVDWSPQGMQYIRDASLSDWGAAFGDAAKQMPSQLVTIFGL